MGAQIPKLSYEAPFYALGPCAWDEVEAAAVTGARLRWRCPALLDELGVAPETPDDALVAAFGHFEPQPGRLHGPLAQRYIGYQFRSFNPHLGDGRGFTLAQIRGRSGTLWDLGTKGSGTTPYSRGGDGRLTLKGGVREIIAAEFLHAMGVKTSRALAVVEHKQDLWRGDEPSPTRASILVRMGEGHIRFGTFERPFYLERDPHLKREHLQRLVDHVVDTYYPELRGSDGPERVVALYAQVVQRTAELVAGWMKAGFCHGVLNTDNMSMTGDSFDYGPFAFMEAYDPGFTAAYFDQQGLYAFERQGEACAWNLLQLARPLSVLAPPEALQPVFEGFSQRLHAAFRRALLSRMGLQDTGNPTCEALFVSTLEILREQGPSYHGLFRALIDRVACKGVEAQGPMLPDGMWAKAGEGHSAQVTRWRQAWRLAAVEAQAAGEPLAALVKRGEQNNPHHVPYRREIERVWQAIDAHDDWQPLYDLVAQLQAPFGLSRSE